MTYSMEDMGFKGDGHLGKIKKGFGSKIELTFFVNTTKIRFGDVLMLDPKPE